MLDSSALRYVVESIIYIRIILYIMGERAITELNCKDLGL